MVARFLVAVLMLAGGTALRGEETAAVGVAEGWEAREAEIVALAREGDLDAAQRKGEEALGIARRELGEDDARTASVLTLLGEIAMIAGRLDEAERLFREGMAIRERVLPPLDSDREQSRNLLALLFAKRGQFDEAERLHLLSLESAEQAAKAGLHGRHAPRWTDLMATLDVLASFYLDRGDGEQAAALRRRALTAVESYGGETPDRQWHYLGELYASARRERDFPLTETIARAQLTVAERHFGKESLAYGEALRSLGEAYWRLERQGEADAVHEEAHAVAARALAADDPRLAPFLGSLAEARLRGGKAAEAEPLYRRALDLMAADGEADPFAKASHSGDLAGIYEETGRVDLAEPLRREVVAIYEPIYGSPSWMLASSTLDLAENLLAQRKLAVAAEAYAKVMTATEPADVAEDDDYARALRRLVEIALREGRLGEAAARWAQVAELRAALLGAEEPRAVAARRDLAALRRVVAEGEESAKQPLPSPAVAPVAPVAPASGQLDPLLRWELSQDLTDLLAEAREGGGAAASEAPKDAALRATFDELEAELLAAEGWPRLAVDRYEEVLTRRLQALGPSDAATRRAAERLAALYDELGRAEDAHAVRDRAGLGDSPD